MATIEEKVTPEVLERLKGALPITDRVNVLIDADSSSNSLFGKKVTKSNNDLLPEKIAAKDKEIASAMEECNQIIDKSVKFHEDFVVRGNQALYKLIADTYAVVLKIQMSEYRSHIINAFKDVLEDQGVKLQVNTTDLLVIIKYIVGGDRKKAFNFSRIIEIAMRENLAAQELPGYIVRRGGISKIYETEQEGQIKLQDDVLKSKRVKLFKGILSLKQWEPAIEINYPELPFSHSDGHDAEKSSFVFFMTHFDRSKNTYKILSSHDFGGSFENSIIKFMTKNNETDGETLLKAFNKKRSRLIEQKLVPEAIAEIWTKSSLSLANQVQTGNEKLVTSLEI